MKPDGGPAFPIFADSTPAGNAAWGGMSLRDYFAGQALAGRRADPEIDMDCDEVARAAYEDADAMLAERAK